MRLAPFATAWCFAIASPMVGTAGAQTLTAGSSTQTAIALPGVQHEMDGVAAEYAYIRAHFPGCKPGTQALLAANGRHYDSIELSGPDCSAGVFFDIAPPGSESSRRACSRRAVVRTKGPIAL